MPTNLDTDRYAEAGELHSSKVFQRKAHQLADYLREHPGEALTSKDLARVVWHLGDDRNGHKRAAASRTNMHRRGWLELEPISHGTYVMHIDEAAMEKDLAVLGKSKGVTTRDIPRRAMEETLLFKARDFSYMNNGSDEFRDFMEWVASTDTTEDFQ